MSKEKVTPPVDDTVIGGGIVNNTKKEKKKGLEEWIAAVLEKIGMDRVVHFLLYAWVTAVGLCYSFTAGVLCFLGMMLLSLIKERLVDKDDDLADWLAGILGGLASMVLYIPKDWLL